MRNLILAFVLLIVVSNALYAQDLKGKSITLKAKSYVSNKAFFIETICSADGIKIKFKIKDSVCMSKLSSDSTYQVLFKSLTNSGLVNRRNDTLKNLLKKIDSVTMANTIYSMDSVKIRYQQFSAYDKLLGNLFSSSVEELENTENNKNRMILDGTGMEFKFINKGTIQSTAYAHSPVKLSHPLLSDYLVTTIGILRSLNKNTLLTKERTMGY